MRVQLGRLFFVVVLFLGSSVEYEDHVRNPNCDSTRDAHFTEGNIGESGLFCWLGVLRVYFYHGEGPQVALTGIVLIKNNFALGNAQDIAKIPEYILTHDSKAMFIERAGSPVELSVARRHVHADYDLYTQHSVALLELNVEEVQFTIRSVCWPSYLYNASSVMYAFGYTDENKLLEKVAYQVQYLKPALCEEFYNKSGLQMESSRRSMESLVCGYAVNMKKTCIWDSGMVMASNTTGAWMIVGLSLHGPGCAAPSRFIDVMTYLPWVHEVTKPGYGFRKAGKDPIIATPVHQFFKETRKTSGKSVGDDEYHMTSDTSAWLNMDKLDTNAYRITPFDTRYEVDGGCDGYERKLLYREHTSIVHKHDQTGGFTYKINLYDMLINGCDCILLKVKCTARSKAVVYHSPDEIKMHEKIPLGHFGDTPDEVIRYFPVTERMAKGAARPTPAPHLRPAFISDDAIRTIAPNVNLFIRIEFKGEGSLSFEMFGPIKSRPSFTAPKPLLRKPAGHKWARRWRYPQNQSRTMRPLLVHPVVNTTSSQQTLLAGPRLCAWLAICAGFMFCV